MIEKDKNGRISAKTLILGGKKVHYQTVTYIHNTKVKKHSKNAYHTIFEYNKNGQLSNLSSNDFTMKLRLQDNLYSNILLSIFLLER